MDHDHNQAQHNNTQHFRLLDLPLELQRTIFEVCYGSWSLKAHYVINTNFEFTLHGLPSKSLLFTCRHIYRLAHRIMTESFNGTLDLRSIPAFVWWDQSSTIASVMEPWSQRIHTVLDASTGNYGPHTPRSLLPFWKQFPRLRQVEIRFSPIIFNADVDWLRGWNWSMEELMMGKADGYIVEKILQRSDHWASLKRQLDREGVEMIVVLEWRRYQLCDDAENDMTCFCVRTHILKESAKVLTRSLEKS